MEHKQCDEFLFEHFKMQNMMKDGLVLVVNKGVPHSTPKYTMAECK